MRKYIQVVIYYRNIYPIAYFQIHDDHVRIESERGRNGAGINVFACISRK